MVASDRTIQEVAKVILRHVPPAVAERIADDLQDVPGNQSFRDTILKLVEALKQSRFV